MRTIEYLTQDPGIFLPPVLTALGVALLGGMLSMLVVLRRLAFVGQGVSHAAFGGVGLALMLGLWGSVFREPWMQVAVVVGFCIGATLWISWASRNRGSADRGGGHDRSDAAIGIALAVSMALGFVLHRSASMEYGRRGFPPVPALESVLFGSVTQVGWWEAGATLGLVLVTAAVLWWTRRPMLFWAFDPAGAEGFGVPTQRMRLVLLLLLTLATVMTTRVAGVVLATAVLVMPGAIALGLSRRLGVVQLLAVVVSAAGALGGMVLAFEADRQPGPMIVLTLAALAAGAWAVRRLGLLDRG